MCAIYLRHFIVTHYLFFFIFLHDDKIYVKLHFPPEMVFRELQAICIMHIDLYPQKTR